MKNLSRSFVAAVTLATLIPFGNAMSGGLRTQLGEVVIENLQPGQRYNLKDLANLKLIVTNTSEYALQLQMDVLVPSTGELKQEAEAIPDASWIDLTQRTFAVEPGQDARSEILINIPDEDRYLGKKYQFVVWSHSLAAPGQGMSLAYGLKSRVIFTIDTVRATVPDLAHLSDADAGFSVGPQEIKIKDVVAGELWNLEDREGIRLTVSNPGLHKRTVLLNSQTVASSRATITEGYEDTPDPTFLRFNENQLELEPGEERQVQLFLEFPADVRHSGHQYMFIIHAQTVGAHVSAGVYSRLYASLR